MSQGRRGPSLPLAVTAIAVAAAVDQVTKTLALRHLEGRDPVHVVWTLQLALAFNSGVAFSLGRGSGLSVVPLALVVVLVVVWVSRSLDGRLAGLAVGLVTGGALSNMADRLVRSHDGAVIDFIDLQWWPVFNVADACVVVGGALLALCSLRRQPGAPDGRPAGGGSSSATGGPVDRPAG